MGKKFSFKPTKEQLAGAIAIAFAILLLVMTMLLLFSCTAGADPTQGSSHTAPMQPTDRGLIPNPYHAGDFAFRDGYPTCISGKSYLGVDVSVYQKHIDWPTVAAQGVEFAMVRLGYRGYGQSGKLMTDTRAVENLQGARDAGLKVGAYFYSQAITVEEAIEEAQLALEILDGQTLDMPLVFDWEIFSTEGRTYGLDRKTVNACAMAFCKTVEAAGYQPMVYFNLDLAGRLFDLEALQKEGYGFWLALYADMSYPHRVDMWQFTSTGYVKGIEGDVDMNLYFTYE